MHETVGRSRYLTVAGYELHVLDWGAPDAPAVVCWHGMSRTGRDFDGLARILAQAGRRVVAPDTLGRGLSQWARDPEREYRYPFYVELATALVDALGLETLDFVGTSMGGTLGMLLAGGPLRGRVRHLVLNDIGPEVDPVGIRRIAAYIGQPPRFATMAEVVAYLKTAYRPFGLDDDEWWAMAEWSVRRTDSGAFTLHYDPRIVVHFAGSGRERLDLWAHYDAITAPTLLIRGETSDILSATVAQAMSERGPKAELVVVPGEGHAPSLNHPERARLIQTFLAR
jgi:pimeloyl-ACP methyl ester carboxylesterase